MGLDMYGFAKRELTNEELLQKALDPEIELSDRVKLSYWRKHNALHSWMHELYRAKGGEDDFNCVDLNLEEEDLLELEKAINIENGAYEKSYKESDLEFVNQAMKFLKDGFKIYYTAWY